MQDPAKWETGTDTGALMRQVQADIATNRAAPPAADEQCAGGDETFLPTGAFEAAPEGEGSFQWPQEWPDQQLSSAEVAQRAAQNKEHMAAWAADQKNTVPLPEPRLDTAHATVRSGLCRTMCCLDNVLWCLLHCKMTVAVTVAGAQSAGTVCRGAEDR